MLVETEKTCSFSFASIGRANIPHSLQVVSDGDEAIHYLLRTGRIRQPHPLPLARPHSSGSQLPRMDGFEVLEMIRAQPTSKALPVLVLTSSIKSST